MAAHGVPTFMWPQLIGLDQEPELMLIFSTMHTQETLVLASNCPYELYLNDTFIGDGGHRCAPPEALIDEWHLETGLVTVRLHYMNSYKTSVWLRCLVREPFLADLSDSGLEWECYLDRGVVFRAKASSQLPRQLCVYRPDLSPLKLVTAGTWGGWRLVPAPIERSRYVEVAPLLCNQEKVTGGAGAFEPEGAEDLADYVRFGKHARGMARSTWDLGRIALHSFTVDTTATSGVVLVFSEVLSFQESHASRNRQKVRLADCVTAGVPMTRLFGSRGCRYVHMFYEARRGPARMSVARREYPTAWRHDADLFYEKGLAPVVLACQANMIACVDGGVVDTCWRERAQWTGDARMAGLALRALAGSDAPVGLALHQIALSYSEKDGMVMGAWPVKHERYTDLRMPTYHLAFCLAAVEADPLLRDEAVRHVVQHSMEYWREHFLRDGLLVGMPGWYFTDWDFQDSRLCSQGPQGISHSRMHAVCNAWWHELTVRVDAPTSQRLDVDAFVARFFTGSAFSLLDDEGCVAANMHATAAVLSSVSMDVLGRAGHTAAQWLEEICRTTKVWRRVTAYYCYFVGEALRRAVSQEACVRFVKAAYLPIAARHGTIYEKSNSDASLAHGWSAAVAALIVGPNDQLCDPVPLADMLVRAACDATPEASALIVGGVVEGCDGGASSPSRKRPGAGERGGATKRTKVVDETPGAGKKKKKKKKQKGGSRVQGAGW